MCNHLEFPITKILTHPLKCLGYLWQIISGRIRLHSQLCFSQPFYFIWRVKTILNITQANSVRRWFRFRFTSVATDVKAFTIEVHLTELMYKLCLLWWDSPFPLHFAYTMTTLGRGSRNQKSAAAVLFF